MSGDDDTARFLRELRQLRNGAGLGHAQLAARAHYPYDSIKAAEVGPSLPDLPVLSAFVRACGGPTQEWEERWRSLTSSPSLPVSATRQTGQSDAATAGARINSAAPAGDGPDPSVILAALNRVAEEMASPADDPRPAVPVTRPAPGLPASSFSSDFPSNEPGAGGKPTGWDPIRVSSAWPALQHTPTVAEPAANTSVPGGLGVSDDSSAPWGAASWAGNPVGAASVPVADAGAAGRGGPGRSSRIAIVLIAVVLLCAVVALLTVLS